MHQVLQKTSGCRLASFLGITPESSSARIGSPAVDPLEALKAMNGELQKANQEQAKQIEYLQKTNTRPLNEMSLLRARVTELTKLIEGCNLKSPLS